MTARKVGDHVEINKEDARAGQTGVGLRYVLVGGIALVVTAFAALGFGWFG